MKYNNYILDEQLKIDCWEEELSRYDEEEEEKNEE